MILLANNITSNLVRFEIHLRQVASSTRCTTDYIETRKYLCGDNLPLPMKPPIGFVLVTYNNPEQTLFLCERLNTMFGNPPIAIHHDFSKSHVNPSLFPGNVHFVENWLRTSWGSISVVNAQLLALRALYATSDPDWFVSLSSSDYPIQTANSILHDLFQNDFDVYLDSRPVKNLGLPIANGGFGVLRCFEHPNWPQVGYNRYVAIPLCSPKMAKRLRVQREKLCLPFTFLTERLTPFHGSITCHGGDAWFTANRRVAHLLLEETPLWRKLHDHYRTRSVPEESFYHTLLANSPGFNPSSDNKRYTDWRGCWAHPRTLGREDFRQLLQSTHHFARKFLFDPEILRNLDDAVALK
jgi:hypothetical protein